MVKQNSLITNTPMKERATLPSSSFFFHYIDLVIHSLTIIMLTNLFLHEI